MRFPLWLTAEVGFALAARGFLRNNGRSPIASVDAADSCAAAGGFAKMNAPAVWIAGSEPLLQPEIARVTRELLRTRRYVFLRTDGALWRRRIHEFQPVSRFFLTIDCSEPGDARAAEAIRIARLSGFFTCVYTEISSGTQRTQLQALRDYVQALRVDGWVIAASSSAGALEHSAVQRNATEARKLIPSRRWQIFSECVEAAIHVAPDRVPSATEVLAAPSRAGVFEESVGAQ